MSDIDWPEVMKAAAAAAAEVTDDPELREDATQHILKWVVEKPERIADGIPFLTFKKKAGLLVQKEKLHAQQENPDDEIDDLILRATVNFLFQDEVPPRLRSYVATATEALSSLNDFHRDRVSDIAVAMEFTPKGYHPNKDLLQQKWGSGSPEAARTAANRTLAVLAKQMRPDGEVTGSRPICSRTKAQWIVSAEQDSDSRWNVG